MDTDTPQFEPPFRQIHMDYHNHGIIEQLASQFDADEFARTLKQAHVNSVTCFARCHHGWMYYDSTLFPSRIHPHLLHRNLLKEQIDACHKVGIRVPVYTSVQWDMETVREHPEWRVVTADGRLAGTPPYEPGFYRHLCLNTPYREWLKSHVREVLETLEVDGMFYDIVVPRDCSCPTCQGLMLSKGIDPTDTPQRNAFARETIRIFIQEISALTWSIRPGISIYYNGTGTGTDWREHTKALSHIEFDALPSTDPEGYMNFPLMARYLRNTGLECVGQTGKFHRWWGDFHAYKNQAALEYDCFQLLALGCKVLVGDQLPPSGKIDAEVYKLVGAVYDKIEHKEPWCRNVKPVVDIGVLNPDEYQGSKETSHGFIRMLEEGGHQFDVIDSWMDFSPYKLVILPDCITFDDRLCQKIEAYLAKGGRLLASFESGMDQEKNRFALECLGVDYAGPGPIAPDGKPARGRKFDRINYADYVLPTGAIGKGLPETEHVMYTLALDVNARPGTRVLAPVIKSVFDRTYEHFTSHNQSPSSGKPGGAAIAGTDNTIYFAHKIFELYALYAPLWVKKLFLNAVEMLLPEPLLRHDGPSTLVATVNAQPSEKRWVVHLLHYIPLRRATELEIIEDVIPLHDVKISLCVPKKIKQIYIPPHAADEMDFWQVENRIEFVVDRIDGHQMICVEFE